MNVWPIGCLPGCCNPPDLKMKKRVPQGEWEHFARTGNFVGVRGTGETLEIALEEAARAMFATITDLDSIQCKHAVTIDCEPDEPDRLLIHWLTALRQAAESRRMLFAGFRIKIKKGKLHAHAWGEKVDPERHRPVGSVGEISKRELWTGPDANGRWIAQCTIEVRPNAGS